MTKAELEKRVKELEREVETLRDYAELIRQALPKEVTIPYVPVYPICPTCPKQAPQWPDPLNPWIWGPSYTTTDGKAVTSGYLRTEDNPPSDIEGVTYSTFRMMNGWLTVDVTGNPIEC